MERSIMAYPDGREGASRRREALLCLIYFVGGANYQLASSETYRPLANFFELSEYERTRPISSTDNRVYWENLVQNSRQQLISQGYLDGSKREIWKLTYEGINRARKIAEEYNKLRQYENSNLKVPRKVWPTPIPEGEIEFGDAKDYLPPRDDFSEENEEILLGLDLPVSETPQAKDFNEPTETNRVLYQNYRIIRDTKLARQIKRLYQFKCQICGNTVELNNGTKYAEAHHLMPLGSPHNGPDIAENIICVCPNHHVQLDYGAIKLEIDKLMVNQMHLISDEYISYHNDEIFGSPFEVS